ncbi:MAG TPA: site-specific integrase [Terriglobales bacterium]|nr:site-specific integrase [Terriglobales bacterium]
MTLAHFVEMYFVPNFFPMLKLSTQKRYRRTFDNHVLPAFGQQRLCDIGTLDIQQFVLAKLRTGLGWACADHYRNLLSKIFAIATKWGYFSGANPASGVQLPEKTPVREKHVLTPDQATRLLNVLNEPARTMVHLALLTGLRIGEILGLPWENVGFAVGEIRIAQAYYRGSLGTPKTKTSKRIVPLPSALRGPLLLLKERSKQSTGLVFQTGNGTPFNDSNLLHRNLKPAGKRLGIPWLNWHSLRRTHATYFQVVGGSLRDAQAQLGHSKMSTTLEVYTIPIAAHQREAVEKISGLMANDGKFAQNPEGLPLASQQIQ